MNLNKSELKTTLKITQPKLLEIIPIINSLKKSTKNENVPFDDTKILQILSSFESHFENHGFPSKVPNFLSIHWKIVEKQANNGFIITPEIREQIKAHRSSSEVLNTSNLDNKLEDIYVNSYNIKNPNNN